MNARISVAKFRRRISIRSNSLLRDLPSLEMMNRNTLDIGSLQIFKAVADTGSVTAAAEKLCYVQPNVSARIKQLEEILKAPLFYRQHRRMILTRAGEALLGYADQILRLVEEAQASVNNDSDEGGVLRIGSLESTAASRLPTVLSSLHRLHPKIQIAVTTGPTDPLVKDVLGYRLDGAFVGGVVDHPDIRCEPTFVENLVLVTEKKYRIESKKHNIVLLSFRHGCPYRIKAEMYFREQGLAPVQIMEFGTLDGILGCVSAGVGVAVLPKSVVDRSQYKQVLKFTSIRKDLAEVQTMFISRRDTSDIRGITLLRNMVVQAK